MLQLDDILRAWVVHHRVAGLDPAMLALSAVGRGGLLWIAAAVALTALRRLHWTTLLRLALALAIASLLADRILKPIVQRERPFMVADVDVIGNRPDDPAFPSGHTANAFAGALVLSHAAPQLAGLWWILATLIGYSRVYLGVHYPLDVLGGALIGAAAGKIAVWIRSS